jgi:hypothetical protein
MAHTLIGFCRIAGATAAMMLSLAAGVDDFPIAGTYVQNRHCRGDGTDPAPLLVTIGADEIKYRGGTCLLSDKRRDGNNISVRAACRFRSGSVLLGDVTFKMRADHNLEMVEPERNYTTVLYRCPS